LLCFVAAIGLLSRDTRIWAAPRGFEQVSQQEAIAAIPFAKLTEDAQAKLSSVVSKPSLYRQLPVTVIESDPDLYRVLIRHPEIIVNMWQLMGVTKVEVERTGPFKFDASDGAGTVCNVELVYGDHNTHVFYTEGTYEGALLRNLIRGRCVLVLQSDYASTQDQQVFVTSRLDMFVQFDNVGAEILAKTLHPLVGRSADHNFTESTKFLGQVSKAAEKKTAGLQRLSAKLDNVKPEVRVKFTNATAAANHRAALRAAGQVVFEQELPTIGIQTAPVVTTTRGLEGASRSFETRPERKPLSLRR
jgi:hypothetical protein